MKVAHPLNYETFRVNFEHLFAKHIPNDLLNAKIDAITADPRASKNYDKIILIVFLFKLPWLHG